MPGGMEYKNGWKPDGEKCTREHDRRDRTTGQAETEKQKRSGDEQTDKNRWAKHPRKVFIVRDI